jgi:hypothetical protein
MRDNARSKPKIMMIEDSGAFKDPVRMLMNATLHPGSDVDPVRSSMHGPDHWVYKGKVFRVDGAGAISDEELTLRIRHEVARNAKEIQQIRREVEAFENMEKVPSAKRERIPDSVRLFVWQRDEGRCVKCASKELLEFDHIIPVVEGGSNTERNIQLLCEACNRKKGRNI